MTTESELCDESEKTKKAREKLKKRLQLLEPKITQESLKKKHKFLDLSKPLHFKTPKKSIKFKF